MNYGKLADEVARNLATGIDFYSAFRVVMRGNKISAQWDVHASEIGKIFARRRRNRKSSKKLNGGERRQAIADILRQEQVKDAVAVARSRGDHLLRDP